MQEGFPDDQHAAVMNSSSHRPWILFGPLAALGLVACARLTGDLPYAPLADDDTTPGPDDDTTPSTDDDSTPVMDDDSTSSDDDSVEDDDTFVPDDDTTPPDDDIPEIFPDPDGSLYGVVSLSSDLVPLFADLTYGCYCHLNKAGPVPGLMLTADQAWLSLVGVESTLEPGRIRVIPGDPEASLTFAKLYQEPSLYPYEGSFMPPAAARLSDEQLNLVYNWILQGANDN